MPKAEANGITIEYETMGDRSGRPLLLIAGLASQLIQWGEDVYKVLAEQGHYVIMYDNRDTGLSTECEVPYGLEDMADDAVGLLDALGVRAAQICGTSMGGMIAQTLAIRHPHRVQSLISIYSTTGNRNLPPPNPEVTKLLLAPPPSERQAHVEHMVKLFRAMAGRGFVFDEDWARMIAAASFDRSFRPEGAARQVNAVMTQRNRKSALASLSIPTLVIHGTDDPVMPVEAGKDTADAIPGSRLMLIEGMGHDLPHGGAWPEIVRAIIDHTSKAKA